MTLKSIAQMIPREFRTRVLKANAIYKAIAIPGDPHMFMLFTLWTTYVNPHGGLDLECAKCLADILQNFKQLQPALEEMARDEALLDQ